MRTGFVGMIVVATMLVSACDGAGTRVVPVGTEGGVCYPNASCNDGLDCIEGVCVGSFVPDGGVEGDGGNVLPDSGNQPDSGSLPDAGGGTPDAGSGSTVPSDGICPGHYSLIGNTIYLKMTTLNPRAHLENVDGLDDSVTRSVDRVPFDYAGGVENGFGDFLADMEDGLAFPGGGATLPVYIPSMMDSSVKNQGSFTVTPASFWVRISGLDSVPQGITWSTYSDPCVRVSTSFDGVSGWDLTSKATIEYGHLRTVERFYQLSEADKNGPLSASNYRFETSNEWVANQTPACTGGCSTASMLLRTYLRTIDITLNGTSSSPTGIVRHVGYVKNYGNVNDVTDFTSTFQGFAEDANLTEFTAIPGYGGGSAMQNQNDIFMDPTSHEIIPFTSPNATYNPNALSFTFTSAVSATLVAPF